MATGQVETVDELLCDILGAPSETDRESKMERRRREVAQSWAELAGEGQVNLGFPEEGRTFCGLPSGTATNAATNCQKCLTIAGNRQRG